jgi:drug/metabolite transporter (DMT)-like permease
MMNVLDKYVISQRVKNILSYAFLAGAVNVLLGAVLAFFLDWSGISLKDMLFPLAAGLLLGSQFYAYFRILSKEDVSNLIGFIYVYPILTAILSYIFLGEVISKSGYLGVGLILIGVLMLSIRLKKVKLSISFWWIMGMIIFVALYEFFIKVATINIPVMNGIAISSIGVGLAMVPVIMIAKVRKGLSTEMKNFKWALMIESFTFSAGFATYFAMNSLPATIVVSIAAIQPLAVLFFERIAGQFVGKMTKDKLILPKLAAITVIVIGVILLYISEFSL